MQAAALERLAELTRPVAREHDHRRRLGPHRPDLGDRDLEVRQELEQERLELLVRAIDLVDEQDRRRLGAQRAQDRTLDEEALREEDVLLPAEQLGGVVEARDRIEQLGDLLAQHLRVEQLLAVLPLVQRLRLVEPLVALQADQLGVDRGRHRLRELGLADAGRPLDEDRLADPRRRGTRPSRGGDRRRSAARSAEPGRPRCRRTRGLRLPRRPRPCSSPPSRAAAAWRRRPRGWAARPAARPPCCPSSRTRSRAGSPCRSRA